RGRRRPVPSLRRHPRGPAGGPDDAGPGARRAGRQGLRGDQRRRRAGGTTAHPPGHPRHASREEEPRTRLRARRRDPARGGPRGAALERRSCAYDAFDPYVCLAAAQGAAFTEERRMSLTRLAVVWRLELGQSVRRPMFWILVLVLGLSAYGLSSGKMTI